MICAASPWGGEYDFPQTDSSHLGHSVEFALRGRAPRRGGLQPCPHHPPESRSGRRPVRPADARRPSRGLHRNVGIRWAESADPPRLCSCHRQRPRGSGIRERRHGFPQRKHGPGVLRRFPQRFCADNAPRSPARERFLLCESCGRRLLQRHRGRLHRGSRRRSTFRLDNYDDGSTVETYQGRVSVLHNKNATRLEKGQSLSVKAGDDSSLSVGRLPEEDDFDRWVSGRIESVSTATTAALQYTGSSYYAPGFADLYTYGAFSSCGAYGFGWRPFGVGFGWSPFTNGQWIMDPSFGYTWVSYQPWGWAPYHYGGWLFDSSCGGWFYSPPVLYGYPGYGAVPRRHFPGRVNPPRVIYHPVTAVFVRQGAKSGIVPMHPLDEKGKTPLNLERGVFSNAGTRGGTPELMTVEHLQKWDVLKSPPRESLSGSLAAAAPPTRVSRTVLESKSGIRTGSLGKDSSIAYDPSEHRFVNTNSPAASSSINEKEILPERGRATATSSTPAAVTPSRTPVAPPVMRSASSPPPRNTVPPPAPRYSGGERGSSSASSGRSSGWGGSASSSGGSSGRSSSSSSSSTSSSHPSSGRPH